LIVNYLLKNKIESSPLKIAFRQAGEIERAGEITQAAQKLRAQGLYCDRLNFIYQAFAKVLYFKNPP
jgi:hypothetical protein